MWTSYTDILQPDVSRTRFLEDGAPLSYQRVIELLEYDKAFRDCFTNTVVESLFDAFFWETPPVTGATLAQTFEFVRVESRSLANLTADPGPFSSRFIEKPEPVLVFPNLGGDATLVVPRPLSAHSHYAHLAGFLRSAPPSQVSEFWRCAAVALRGRVSAAPLWLSTAGMGVSWLHLRLDSHPKYYRHAPYKK